MITAEPKYPRAGLLKRRRTALDGLVCLNDVNRIGTRVAGVNDLALGKRRQVKRVVIRAQQQRGLPNRGRSVAGPGAKRGAAVERSPEDPHISPASQLKGG